MEKLLFKCHTTFDFRGIVVFIHSLLQIRDILLISIIEGLYNYLYLPIEYLIINITLCNISVSMIGILLSMLNRFDRSFVAQGMKYSRIFFTERVTGKTCHLCLLSFQHIFILLSLEVNWTRVVPHYALLWRHRHTLVRPIIKRSRKTYYILLIHFFSLLFLMLVFVMYLVCVNNLTYQWPLINTLR